jgi:hypothetical protein
VELEHKEVKDQPEHKEIKVLLDSKEILEMVHNGIMVQEIQYLDLLIY